MTITFISPLVIVDSPADGDCFLPENKVTFAKGSTPPTAHHSHGRGVDQLLATCKC